MPKIRIGKKFIGNKFPPIIIVELGINYKGNITLAKKLIDKAKIAGAEIIKNQTHIPYFEMSEEAKKIIPVHAKNSIYKIISNASISEKNEKKIKKYCEKKKLIYISTPFSREAADRLNKMNVQVFKIGSGECNNYPLIEYICKFKKPIILSTGMNDIKSIKKSVKIIEKHKINYALLHTTNVYPTLHKQVRLNAIMDMKKHFPNAVLGLSDHTGDNYTSFAALGMGASIIEKHFIDDKKKRKGPDISASIDYKQLKDLISGSKKIFQALPGSKKPIKEEISTMKFAFSSVVATRSIKKNEILNESNIWVKRPGTGDFLPKDLKKLYGMKVNKNIQINTQIKKEYLH